MGDGESYEADIFLSVRLCMGQLLRAGLTNPSSQYHTGVGSTYRVEPAILATQTLIPWKPSSAGEWTFSVPKRITVRPS